MTNDEKDQKLCILIEKISNYEIDKVEAENEIKGIFDNEYNCSSSKILPILIELQGESLDFLQSFLDSIINSDIINGDIHTEFMEFHNFISTEIIRISSNRQLAEKSESFMKEMNLYKSILDSHTESMSILNQQIEQKETQISSINNNHISILGIFSGIVMVFFGGLNFAENTLQNISSISIYRLTFVTCLVGFVMFNCLFILLYFVSKLTSSDIREKCKKCTDETAMTCDSCKQDTSYNICANVCKPIEKFKNLYPIIFYVDVCLFVCMGAVFAIWAISNHKMLDIKVVAGLGLIVLLYINPVVNVNYVFKKLFNKFKKNNTSNSNEKSTNLAE